MYDEKRDNYTKKEMQDSGILKDKQTKKYAMYYIFHNEEPIYVGVTNNFARRKSEHFSKTYRRKQSNSRLYKYMNENDTGCYEMYIVLQSKTAKEIEELEAFHISKLRSFKFGMTNKSSGGGYTDFINHSVRDNVRRFISKFNQIEDISIECYDEFIFDVDKNKLDVHINKLDWNLLRSVESYKTVTLTEAYDSYIRKNSHRTKEDEEVGFEYYVNDIYTLSNTLSLDRLIEDVSRGYIVSYAGMTSAISRLLDLIDILEDSEDSIEVFVALKILTGCDYQDEILPIISEYDSWKYYDLEDYIKGCGEEPDVSYLHYKGEVA